MRSYSFAAPVLLSLREKKHLESSRGYKKRPIGLGETPPLEKKQNRSEDHDSSHSVELDGALVVKKT